MVSNPPAWIWNGGPPLVGLLVDAFMSQFEAKAFKAARHRPVARYTFVAPEKSTSIQVH